MRKCALFLAVLVFSATVAWGHAPTGWEPLSFEDRVQAQEAIERVFYLHRIWPKENPGPKPPFHEVVTRDALEAKVADYLLKSDALENSLHRTLMPSELQAEVDRMTRETRDRETLGDLFEALGHDPVRIAECLARPILSERLMRSGLLEFAPADGDLGEILPAGFPLSDDFPIARHVHVAVWTGAEMIIWGGEGTWDYLDLNSGGLYRPATDSWQSTSTGEGCPAGKSYATAIWSGTEMIVWGGFASGYDNTGGRYNPASDSWLPTSTGTSCPSPRRYHTAIWTGTEMIIWGGALDVDTSTNTGGRYDPATGSWQPTPTGTGCPSVRELHTAVWTGSEMVIWGGEVHPATALRTGGRYNPATNSWTSTSTGSGCPSERRGHAAVWTGSAMVVWGGGSYISSSTTGGRYDPTSNSWSPTATGTNCPTSRFWHTAVWTGSAMIIWGGRSGYTYLNTGATYDPLANTWQPTSTGAGCPPGRYEHTAVWTGTEMIVWGGNTCYGSAGCYLDDGGRYEGASDNWLPMAPNCQVTCSASASPAFGSVPLVVHFASSASASHCAGSLSYSWSFGDGSSSTVQNPQHTYATEGTFSWTLTASTDGVSCTHAGTVTVNPPPCSLTCSASANPTTGNVPLSVSFTSSATPSHCLGQPSFHWEFGDGGTSSDQNPSHSYAEAGDYTWTLTVSADDAQCTMQGIIHVNPPCSLTCSASANPATGPLPLAVLFSATAAASYCSGSPTYAWSFGDGASSTQKNVTHTYGDAGTYQWTLIVAVEGKTCSKTGTITVTPPCTVSCTAMATPSSGPEPLAVQFRSTVNADYCTESPTFLWAFGDGGVSADQEPVHTFASRGSYNWNLFVTVGSKTCTRTGTVTVTPPCSLDCTASAEPTSGIAPLAASFTAAASVTDCSEVPSFSWSFGDASTSSGQSASHTYEAPGEYVWSLTVSAGGATCTRGGVVIVSPPCSIACAASYSPSAGIYPLSVTFSAAATSAHCNGVPTYAWVFGDGGVSTEQSPVHTYVAAGTYEWTLEVSADEQACIQSGTVQVDPPPPVIGSIRKLSGPFRFSVSGSNLQNGIQVYINGALWTNVKWKNAGSIVIKGGSALKQAVPRGVSCEFRFVNPDGGAATWNWQW